MDHEILECLGEWSWIVCSHGKAFQTRSLTDCMKIDSNEYFKLHYICTSKSHFIFIVSLVFRILYNGDQSPMVLMTNKNSEPPSDGINSWYNWMSTAKSANSQIHCQTHNNLSTQFLETVNLSFQNPKDCKSESYQTEFWSTYIWIWIHLQLVKCCSELNWGVM